MEHERLISVVRNTPLAEYADYLTQTAVRMLTIQRRDTANVKSRFAGSPDLPPGFSWPQHEDGYYRFLLQLDLGEMSNCIPAQPNSGLLVLFEKFDEGGNMDWTASDYIVASYFPDPTALITTESPAGREVHHPIPITFKSAWDIPLFDYFIESTYANTPLPKAMWREYSEVRDALHESPDFCFGCPTSRCLGFDPLPGPDWLQLLNLDSDEDIEWNFHDGGKLMIFIETARLANCDFTHLSTVAG